MRILLSAMIGALLLLVACTPDASASVTLTTGDLIYENRFDDPESWQSFGFIETQFGIRDGQYTAISPGGGYIVATNEQTHQNMAIDAIFTQESTANNNAYGLMCRSQPANENIGYYFLISGNGQYSIRMGDGTRVRMLVPWTDHSAIKRGQATNALRIVCVDDYLALYVNERFVHEIRHDWLKAGYTGIVVNTQEGVRVAVTVDDVEIRSATVTP